MAAYLARRFAFAVLLVFSVSSAALVLTRLAPGDFADQTLVQTGQSRRGRGAARALRPEPIDRRAVRRLAVEGGPVRLRALDGLRPAGAGPDLRTRGQQRDPRAQRAGARHARRHTRSASSPARRRGVLPQAVRGVSVLLLSMPPLLTSLVLVFLAARTGWLPVGGMFVGRRQFRAGPRRSRAPHDRAGARARRCRCRRCSSGCSREAMGETIGQPFVLASIARGVPPARIVWRDALKPALRPVVSVYGLVVGTLLSGSFAVEIITSWPGLGQLMLNALRQRDIYLVAGLRGDWIDLPGRRHVPVRRRPGPRRSAHNGMSGRPISAAGVLTLGAAALAGLLAPWIAPHDPNTRYPELAERAADPGSGCGRRAAPGGVRSSTRGFASANSSSGTRRIGRGQSRLRGLRQDGWRNPATTRGRRCSCSAPTATAATCSPAAVRGADVARAGARRRTRRDAPWQPSGRDRRIRRRSARRCADAGIGVRARPADDVRRARAQGRDAARPAGRGRLRAARRDFRRRRRAVHLARRARDRAVGTPARLRGGRRRTRRRPRPHRRAASAAGRGAGSSPRS